MTSSSRSVGARRCIWSCADTCARCSTSSRYGGNRRSTKGISCPTTCTCCCRFRRNMRCRRWLGTSRHQGQERNPSGPGLCRAQAQLRGAALLGQGILPQHARPGRRSHPSIHPQPREEGSEARTIEPSGADHAAFGRLQTQRAASATRPTALSGSHHEAPGFAGGYLRKRADGVEFLNRVCHDGAISLPFHRGKGTRVGPAARQGMRDAQRRR